MTQLKGLLFVLIMLLAMNGWAQTPEEIDITRKLPPGYVKDGSKDYTELLQGLINQYDHLLMPDFPILINDKGLQIGSNTSLRFQPHSRLILKASDKGKYAMILIKDAQNVNLYGATLVGDRATHEGTTGEWGMGIQIEGSENVLIKNARITHFWGDGIYITRGKNNAKNINILNTTFKKNRRNGISIISGEDITIRNVAFIQMDGTRPMAGIDIEPNSREDELGQIMIDSVRTHQCRIGIQIALRNYPSEQVRKVNISIDELTSVEDSNGLRIADLYRAEKYGPKVKPLEGKITIQNVQIKGAKEAPIKYFRPKGYRYSPAVILKKIDIAPNPGTAYRKNLKRDMERRGFNVKAF